MTFQWIVDVARVPNGFLHDFAHSWAGISPYSLYTLGLKSGLLLVYAFILVAYIALNNKA